MKRIILFGGPIYDTEQDALLDNKMVVIEGDRIKTVDSMSERPVANDSTQLIDVQGRSILPGLVDSHCHVIGRTDAIVNDELIATGVIEGITVASQLIGMGITTVRDAGCKHGGIYALKQAIDDGQIKGPRLFVAGLNPTGTGSPAHWRSVFVDGPWEMRKAVRQQWQAGADWIKLVLSEATNASSWSSVIQYLTDEELIAAVEEAHAKNLRISCHCEGQIPAAAAIAAGVDCIDHGTVLDDELAERMAHQDICYIPTLWNYSIEREWGDIRSDQIAAYKARQAEHRRSVQRALAADVTIGAGSDSVYPIPPLDCLVSELEALIGAGMSLPQALRAATINGARILGLEEQLGSLTPGKLADIIVVDGNPLEDIRALAHPHLVMKAGRLLIDTFSS